MSDSRNTVQDEPSMEEILTSIRKIISEEGEDVPEEPELSPEKPEPSPKEPETPSQEDRGEIMETSMVEDESDDEDVLELSDMVGDNGQVVDLAAKAGAQPESEAVSEPEPEPEPKEEPTAEAKPEANFQFVGEADEKAGPEEPMVTGEAANLSTVAFATLAEALVRERLGAGRTIEDLIKEILKPLLKDWIDKNLADLVKILIQEEIQRMADRARRM